MNHNGEKVGDEKKWSCRKKLQNHFEWRYFIFWRTSRFSSSNVVQITTHFFFLSKCHRRGRWLSNQVGMLINRKWGEREVLCFGIYAFYQLSTHFLMMNSINFGALRWGNDTWAFICYQLPVEVIKFYGIFLSDFFLQFQLNNWRLEILFLGKNLWPGKLLSRCLKVLRKNWFCREQTAFQDKSMIRLSWIVSLRHSCH